jgi:hypothetical protein
MMNLRATQASIGMGRVGLDALAKFEYKLVPTIVDSGSASV